MPDDDPNSTPFGSEPLILPRRRAAPARDAAEEAEHSEDLADLAESVKALSDRLSGPAPGSAAADPARSSKRWKKVTQPTRPELLPAPAPGEIRPAAPRRPGLNRPAVRRQATGRRTPAVVWIAAQAFGFGLIALGYLVGHVVEADDAKKPKAPESVKVETPLPEPVISRGVSERAFQTVTLAMAAAKEGNASRARDALEDAQRTQVNIPGTDYRLALLAIGRGDLKEAKLRLDCAMAANQELAGCCYVRAMLAGAIGDYARAADECAKAAYAEPFSARYLFFWAECLRRNGRIQESIRRFEEALTRPASPADLEFIAFKLRLVKIEAGRAGEFSAELTKNLSLDPVPASWLLTAAALELEANDPAAAALHLQRASREMPAADFDLQTRDYLFVTHSSEKEVATFFNRTSNPASPSPNVAAITVDPLSWTLQSADPGAWPSAAHR